MHRDPSDEPEPAEHDDHNANVIILRYPIAARPRFSFCLSIFDLRSLVAIMRVFNELLIDPTVSIVAPPDLTENKPAGDRSSGNDDTPKVPDFRPSGFLTLAQCLKMIMAPCCHFRCRALSARAALCWPSVAAKRSNSSTCWRSRFNSRNRFARSRGDPTGLGNRSFDPRRTLEVII
jgi:hypothetical protein